MHMDEELENVWISKTAKALLDSKKLHEREPYYEVLDRVLNIKPDEREKG